VNETGLVKQILDWTTLFPGLALVICTGIFIWGFIRFVLKPYANHIIEIYEKGSSRSDDN
jgi:hypothetical protein